MNMKLMDETKKPMKAKAETRGIIAIDNGGDFTKVAKLIKGEAWILDKPIPSEKVYGWERSVGDEADSEYDFVIEWAGELYFAGYLANREQTATKLYGFTKSKNTDYFILSVLLSIFLHGYDVNYVVTCIPIEQDGVKRDNERSAIAEKLNGVHTITVNGEKKTFEIKGTLVVQEGINAFWVNRPRAKVRWLDLGSRTVNFATTEVKGEEVFPIAGESGTLSDGIERLGVKNYINYAKSLEGQLGKKSWDTNDKIYILGGGALIPALVDALQEIYPNSEVPDDPQNMQVRGMLVMGEFEFDNELKE